MDLHQLKTFVAVARGGSITRAAELVHLSQPAVSAHIKAVEDALGVTLFDRTSKGMTLTADGQRLLAKAEQTLAAHQSLMDEAARGKGQLTGHLRLGVGTNSDHAAIGRLMSAFAERHPQVELTLKHASSPDIVAGLRDGTLDAGIFNDGGEAEAGLTTLELSRFSIFVVTAPGQTARVAGQPDWRALGALPWIFPPRSACCARAAEKLFASEHLAPPRLIHVDRQLVTRTLVASGLGVGLLHDDVARAAEQAGEVELVHELARVARVVFAFSERRATEAILAEAAAIVRR